MSRRYVVTHVYEQGDETYYFETDRDLYAEFEALDEDENETIEYAKNVFGIEFDPETESLGIIAIDSVVYTKI